MKEGRLFLFKNLLYNKKVCIFYAGEGAGTLSARKWGREFFYGSSIFPAGRGVLWNLWKWEERRMEERDSFKSRLGFILVSAGCAIGIGNVWKFPYITGEYGGAVFVLFYLVFLLLLGIPVVTMELAVGRASHKSVLRGFQALEPKGSWWHIHGWVCLLGSFILMVYYTTISGWMVDYFVRFLDGSFHGLSPQEVAKAFDSMVADPVEMVIFMGINVLVGFLVCAGGVAKSLEKVTKCMMLGLLGLIVILALNSILLPGAGKGLEFYLLPDWNRAVEAGIGNVAAAAMNQAFFTLSVGQGSMEIFASYMSRDHALTGEAVRITALDTFVALLAGMIIFPACFAFGVEPSEGPSLIFVTLPNIFIHMPMGQLWGSLFFVFMTFASFSTVTAVFEALIGNCMDNFGWSRKKSGAGAAAPGFLRQHSLRAGLQPVVRRAYPGQPGYPGYGGLHRQQPDPSPGFHHFRPLLRYQIRLGL